MTVRRSNGTPLPPELLAELRAAATELGEHKLVEELGLDSKTVGRALSGFGVLPGTVAAIRLFLIVRDKAA